MNKKKIVSVLIAGVVISTLISTRPNKQPAEAVINYTTLESMRKEESIPVKVHRTATGQTEVYSMEEYIKGVISSEMSPEWPLEALKAQAIASRTYLLNRMLNNIKYKDTDAHISDNVETQVFVPVEDKFERWGAKKDEYMAKLDEVVKATKGLFLTHNGNIITALYFASTGERTENTKDVFGGNHPYLVSVESRETTTYYKEIVMNRWTFFAKLKEKYPNMTAVSGNIHEHFYIHSYTEANTPMEINANGNIIGAVNFRKLYELPSTDFKIEFTEGHVYIKVKGYGHGVGMSQNGAKDMANQGAGFEEILKHYYTGVEINEI